MPDYTEEFTNIPYGPLGIIALPGCEELAEKIDRYIVKWRAQKQSEHKHSIAFAGYEKDTYLINASFPVSEQVKARVRSLSLSEATIFSLLPMCSITVLPIKSTVRMYL